MDFMINLCGVRFGRLLVLSLYQHGTHIVPPKWLCKCDCGNEKIISGKWLKRGTTKSCGCLWRESITTHGMHDIPEYAVYAQAKYRCENSSAKFYDSYGGRGIKFNFTDFAQFIEHLGRRPKGKYTLDRINNDGNYELGNVRWATPKEQACNRRPNSRWF
jgi:hypothetical protein